jgi:HD-like signal output (HDOD) protein
MEDKAKSEKLKKIVADQSIPSLSPVALQLINAATDERTSARDLGAIIQRDPGLATRLFRVVNSASFARKSPVTSVIQAVVALGFKKIRVMALSLSLRDTFPLGKVGTMDYDYFWQTSLYRALIARDFVRASADCPLDPEEAFLAGLILEVGLLLIYQSSKEAKESFPGLRLPMEELLLWEQNTMGLNHRDVGRFAMEQWGFPEPIMECQLFFGDSAIEPGRSFLCVVAELARRATEFVFGQCADPTSMFEKARRLLGVDQENIDSILSETFRNVEDLAGYLQISLDSQKEMMEALEKWKQTSPALPPA